MTEPVMPLDPASWSETDKQSEAFINPLHILQLLRSAGGGLLAQAGLYGQLVNVEWALEKQRLLGMLVASIVAFAFLLCLLALVIVLVLAMSWDGPYRIQAVLALMLLYGTALCLAWRRFQSLRAQSRQAFAAVREELSTDLALLKSALVQGKS